MRNSFTRNNKKEKTSPESFGYVQDDSSDSMDPSAVGFRMMLEKRA
jgi:hypothetical protein